MKDVSPLPVQVLQDINQLWFVGALGAIVHYNVATLLGDNGLTIIELAEQTGTQQRWLYRVLRFLATRGYFALEGNPPTVRNTPLSAVLCENSPSSLRALALTTLGWRGWQQWGQLAETMKTGQSAAERVLGMSTYDWFNLHPEESNLFDQAMRNFAATVNTAIVTAFDFSFYPSIIDVGGGNGSLLELIHQQYPNPTLTLFDRPLVIEKLAQSSPPFEAVAGDFFRTLPSASLYLFKEVLHNWSDEECVQLLGQCRRANERAAVLISEQVIGLGHNFAEALDLQMGLEQTGCERTQEEFSFLFQQAGYCLPQIIPTRSAHTLLLAEVAS
jgi:hypothetical protein